MARSGKLVIFVIVAVGLAAALFAAWHQYETTRQTHRFWGADHASLIARAPKVEALWLDPFPAKGSACPDPLEIPGGTACVLGRRDVSQAPGISNLRHGLTQDATFQWKVEPPDAVDSLTNWEFALRFDDNGREVVLVFDVFDQAKGQVAAADTSRAVMLDPSVAAEFAKFFTEHFGDTKLPE